MLPRTFSNSSKATLRTARRLALAVGRIDLLLAVARCDSLGRPPIVPDFLGENRLEEMARADGIFSAPPQALVRGRDLLRQFSISPSPAMGKLLRQLFEAQLDEKFSTVAGGLALAAQMLEERGPSK
jgi:tRNA nucleotidyltransferase (CCA-adding enzyme)